MNAPVGVDAGPIEEVDRAADLAGEVDVGGEGQLQRAAERDGDAGGEGDRRIPGIRVEHQPQRAAGAHRQVLVDRDGDGRIGSMRIGCAVVIADDEQPAGIQIKAVDMAVGPNQIGSDCAAPECCRGRRAACIGRAKSASGRRR